MAKRERTAAGEKGETLMDLRHLRRETRTALELAVVALAPLELIDRLGEVGGAARGDLRVADRQRAGGGARPRAGDERQNRAGRLAHVAPRVPREDSAGLRAPRHPDGWGFAPVQVKRMVG